MYPVAPQASATPLRGATPPEHSAISRWSHRVSLLALLFGVSYFLVFLIWRLAALPTPSWAPLAVALLPALDVLLAGVGAVLNMGDMLHILRRPRDYDPQESAKEFAEDDVTELLSRLRPGCVVRLTMPLALIVSTVGLLLGLLPLPDVDNLQVRQGPSVQSCAARLGPFTFEVDNSTSTVDVTWSAEPVETLRDGTTPWATLQPEQGALKAGERATVEVVPNVLVCQALKGARGGARVLAAVIAASVPATSVYHVRITSTGKTHRTTTLTMSLTTGEPSLEPNLTPTATPTITSTVPPTPTRTPVAPTVTPTPTPTPIPPHVDFRTDPTDKIQQCINAIDLIIVDPYALTLDNTRSDVAVGWQISFIGSWASASSISGTVGAGQTATITIAPDRLAVCFSSPAAVESATLYLSFPQGGYQGNIPLTDTIYPA